MTQLDISQSRNATRHSVALVGFIVACYVAAATGAFFPPDDWYRSLHRPSFAPPNWLFGPVWTVLYLMMAISAWLVWKKSGFSAARTALTAFGIQLLLNGMWTALFFGLHSPGLAFAEILALWAAIAATMAMFLRHSRIAALLLAPYLAWVTFAAALNYSFWSLNS